MRVIVAPRVQVISGPAFTPHVLYELPSDGTPAERIIATGGKVCYDTYGADGNPVESHVRNLVRQGHLAVIEHVHVGVFIEGISRGCSHEIVRHRLFNYSQRSTRYTAEGDAAIVLDPYYASLDRPDANDGERQLLNDFVGAARIAIAAYSQQVDRLAQLNPNGLTGKELRKWCRGKARQLLPHALETRMVMTGNLRAWRHFLLMRTSRHAEAEIRRLAAAIHEVLVPLAPSVFVELEAEYVDGFPELRETGAKA